MWRVGILQVRAAPRQHPEGWGLQPQDGQVEFAGLGDRLQLGTQTCKRTTVISYIAIVIKASEHLTQVISKIPHGKDLGREKTE